MSIIKIHNEEHTMLFSSCSCLVSVRTVSSAALLSTAIPSIFKDTAFFKNTVEIWYLLPCHQSWIIILYYWLALLISFWRRSTLGDSISDRFKVCHSGKHSSIMEVLMTVLRMTLGQQLRQFGLQRCSAMVDSCRQCLELGRPWSGNSLASCPKLTIPGFWPSDFFLFSSTPIWRWAQGKRYGLLGRMSLLQRD